MPTPPADPDPLVLYETATTIFLGLGVASVFQTRLVSDKDTISTRAARNWRAVDLVGSGAVLVLLGAGMLLAQTVVARGHPEGGDELTIQILLGITASWVVVKFILQEALRLAWKSSHEATYGGALIGVLAAIGGFALGGAVLLGVIFRSGLQVIGASIAGAIGGVASVVVISMLLKTLFPDAENAPAGGQPPPPEPG